jgi:hypothetical protein
MAEITKGRRDRSRDEIRKDITSIKIKLTIFQQPDLNELIVRLTILLVF